MSKSAAKLFLPLKKLARNPTFTIIPEIREIHGLQKIGPTICEIAMTTREAPKFEVRITSPVSVYNTSFHCVIGDLIAKINAMIDGEFCLLPCGEIVYSAAWDVDPRGFDIDQIQALFSEACGMFHRFFPAFMGVLYGEKLPDEAIFLATLDVEED